MARCAILCSAATDFVHHLAHERLVRHVGWLHGIDTTCLREAGVARGVHTAVDVCAENTSGTWRQEAHVLQTLAVFESGIVTRRGRHRKSESRQPAFASLVLRQGSAALFPAFLATFLVHGLAQDAQVKLHLLARLLLLVDVHGTLPCLSAARLECQRQVLIESLSELTERNILHDPLRFHGHRFRIYRRWLHSVFAFLDLESVQEVRLLR